MAEEFRQEEAPSKKLMNPLVIVLIIFGIVFCCCIAITIMLVLLGPAVGTVFSNIIEGIGTPMP